MLMTNKNTKNKIEENLMNMKQYLLEQELICEENLPKGENEIEEFKNFIISNYLEIFKNLLTTDYRVQNQIEDFLRRGNTTDYCIERISGSLVSFRAKKKFLEALVSPDPKKIMEVCDARN